MSEDQVEEGERKSWSSAYDYLHWEHSHDPWCSWQECSFPTTEDIPRFAGDEVIIPPEPSTQREKIAANENIAISPKKHGFDK